MAGVWNGLFNGAYSSFEFVQRCHLMLNIVKAAAEVTELISHAGLYLLRINRRSSSTVRSVTLGWRFGGIATASQFSNTALSVVIWVLHYRLCHDYDCHTRGNRIRVSGSEETYQTLNRPKSPQFQYNNPQKHILYHIWVPKIGVRHSRTVHGQVCMVLAILNNPIPSKTNKCHSPATVATHLLRMRTTLRIGVYSWNHKKDTKWSYFCHMVLKTQYLVQCSNPAQNMHEKTTQSLVATST